jgi:hypothetical protein
MDKVELRDGLKRVCHGNVGLAPRPTRHAGAIMHTSPERGS